VIRGASESSVRRPTKETTEAPTKDKRKADRAATRLARWSKESPIRFAMAQRGYVGSGAVTYLRHALGLSRTRAYELLRGAVQPDEAQIKVLAPMLGKQAAKKLLVRVKDDFDRRTISYAEAIIRERGDTPLADALKAFAAERMPT